MKNSLKISVKEKEMYLTDTTPFTVAQMREIAKTTPKRAIKERPARGGGSWKYVATSYVIRKLNRIFGYNWSFECLTSEKDALEVAIRSKCVIVKCRLTINLPNGQDIVKEQFGRKQVSLMKDKETLLDFGNDMKAACSDGLKKCASEIGLFSDVYAPEDFIEVDIQDGETIPQTKVDNVRVNNAKEAQVQEHVVDVTEKSTQMADILRRSQARMNEIVKQQKNDSDNR